MKKVNEKAKPKSDEMQENSEEAFLPEHEYSSIEDIAQLIGQYQNEECKAIALKILHRGLNLFREILAYHTGNEQGYLLLLHAENYMDRLSRMVAASEEDRKKNLRELFALQRQALKPPHELIQPQTRSQNPKAFHRTDRDNGLESVDAFSHHQQPCHLDSMSSKWSLKILKLFCKSVSSKTTVNPLHFPVSCHPSSISFTVTADNVSPDGGK